MTLATAKEELRQMWNDLNEAIRTRDQAALERIYAEEFVFVHARVGGIANRAKHLKVGMASPVTALPTPDFDKIQLYGEVAVLRSVEGSTLGTSIYAKRQGHWQILQVQSTPLPLPQKPVELDPKVLASYIGKYEQTPGRFAVINVESDMLRIVFPNALTWVLHPSGDDQFFVPEGLNRILFHRTDNGRVKYYTAWLPNGQIIKGTKID